MFLDAFVSVLVDMEGDGLKKVVSNGSIAEVDDYDLSKLLDHKPRLNVERQKSFDESELLIAANWENLDNPRTLGVRSGMDTIPDTPASYSLHPAVTEGWEAIRRSLVHFRGQPVGTLAAHDHATEEVLNYDQVKKLCTLLFLEEFELLNCVEFVFYIGFCPRFCAECFGFPDA